MTGNEERRLNKKPDWLMLLWAFLFGLVLIIMGFLCYFAYRAIEKDKYELYKMRNELIKGFEVPSRKLVGNRLN
jgi:hypothetical protein